MSCSLAPLTCATTVHKYTHVKRAFPFAAPTITTTAPTTKLPGTAPTTTLPGTAPTTKLPGTAPTTKLPGTTRVHTEPAPLVKTTTHH